MGKVWVFGMTGLVIIGLVVLATVLIPVVRRWWKKVWK